VPLCQRHDVNYNIAVEYREVPAGEDLRDNTTTEWRRRVVDGDKTNVQLKLPSRLSYQVRVKSLTSAGFNASLHAQPLIISAFSE